VAAASEIKANASRDPDFVEQILKWYSLPAGMQKLREVGQGHPNFYGLYDLHGLVWEWTQDFNSVFVTGDNRQDGDKSLATVCGAGATDASSRSDYAAFMRYAMRSSVEARFSQGNLGFRCAYDKK
jgi:formylglycine-generating enzyme required for sulfatase activity